MLKTKVEILKTFPKNENVIGDNVSVFPRQTFKF